MIIVQIGTNIGKDECSNFIFKNKDKITHLFLIEPQLNCIKHIKTLYKDFKNVNIFNIAITDNPEIDKITLYYPKNNKISGHTSSIEKHLYLHRHKEIEAITVPALTLDKFFTVNNINKCDRLYIDTEGLDCKILLGFDYSKYNIQYIEFEVIHSDAPLSKGEIYKNCVDKFIKNGYKVEKSNIYNDRAIKI